ncbi:phosphoethanolamine transferase [Oxalicibacterium flavum]|uniref:phosphoethanolamine transferase n=1 Tax=Oxalicibacterium flavum TaxID=179467 RepID=UPI0016650F75|nr:phosphoethanolamine--lipid A transferase [Oxalicibacterium flavum]
MKSLSVPRAVFSRYWSRSTLPSWHLVVSAELLALIASLYFTLTANHLFLNSALQGRDWGDHKTWLLAIALLLAITGIHTALFLILFSRRTAKPLLITLLVITAAASYYMNRYTVFFNGEMIRNILRTDFKEASELLSLDMLLHILLYAGVPIALLSRMHIAKRRWTRTLWIRPLCVIAAAVVTVAAVLPVFQDFSAMMRNQKEMRFLIMPGAYLTSFTRVLASDGKQAATGRISISEDARLGALWAHRSKPMLFVLVVGETTRAANWGLNGYARQTTPRLASLEGIINFPYATSCGTNTEVSVPCMFSPFGRHDYDEEKIRSHESLLHLIHRTGISTVWRDNQSGCKGVCDGLPMTHIDTSQKSPLCDGERCLDDILTEGMDTDIQRAPNGNVFVVLHQLGNHGPAYYKRYPPELRRFVPTCDTADLGKCTKEQIVNAYDNGVLGTDRMLASTIAYLKTQTHYDTAMLYLSDHGESLGEHGIFLHGLPYSIAPKEQTQIPMVMWMSSGFSSSFGINRDCISRRANQPISQDHLFHSLLGLLRIESKQYDPAWDAFKGCRA